MGDRYELDLDCAYCKILNHKVWIAPTCSVYCFTCKNCGKENFVTADFEVKPIEEVSAEDVKDAFLNSSNTVWGKEKLDKIISGDFGWLKGKVKLEEYENAEWGDEMEEAENFLQSDNVKLEEYEVENASTTYPESDKRRIECLPIVD